MCSFFDSFSELDYARGGAVVDQDVVIEPEAFAEFAMTFTMLEPLKKLGLNVQLKHGVLALEDPFTVCSAGDVLTPDQARLLVRQACIVITVRPMFIALCVRRSETLLEAACNIQDSCSMQLERW